MSTSILSVIQHYQRSIESSQDNESRLLHCIDKLYKLPVKVEHLQETGIGKTVNSLRKYHGEIGVAAKALVTKWKAMVAAEEESADTRSQVHSAADDDDNANNASEHGSSDDDNDNDNHIRSSNNSVRSSNANHDRRSAERHQSSSREDGKHHRHERDGKSTSSTKDKHSSKGKHSRDEKSHKNAQEHSSKHKKHTNHNDEKDAAPPEHKRRKDDDREEKSERKDAGEQHHKHEKAEKHKERSEKHISDSDVKHGSSSTHKDAGDSKETKHTESSRSNDVHAKSSRHCDNGKHSSSSSKTKQRDEKSKEEKHDKKKSSSRDKSIEHNGKTSKLTSHSSSSSKTSPAKSDKKRQRNADAESSDEAMAEPKAPKIQKASKHKTAGTNEGDDGIDSSMGANFADVLGMLNIPTKKSKKSSNTAKSPNVSSTSTKSSSKEDTSAKIHINSQIDSKSQIASSSNSAVKQKPSDVKPDLLTSSAKLEPLDPSIVLELPAISTNYKPLPVNQTVMDCVYNNFAPTSAPKPVRTLTDAEALSHGISSKTMRTKIYSGIKTGQILQVPSLFDLCIRVLQKNIDALEYTGGVPFEVLRPVLERATPHQLLVFEDYNPYLMEDSDVLWKHHVARNYRIKKRQEMESWREMFLRCQEEEERRLNSLTQSIKQSQKIIAAPVRKTQLAFVDSMVKPPRNVLRKQEQYGTKSKLVATPAARVAALSNVTPNAAKVGDTRLRVATATRDPAQVSNAAVRPKKAPLMAKTLQSMRGIYKR